MKEIPMPWQNLMTFVESEVPHGTILIKIVDYMPQKCIKAEREIRFDKGAYFPPAGGVKGRGLGIESGA